VTGNYGGRQVMRLEFGRRPPGRGLWMEKVVWNVDPMRRQEVQERRPAWLAASVAPFVNCKPDAVGFAPVFGVVVVRSGFVIWRVPVEGLVVVEYLVRLCDHDSPGLVFEHVPLVKSDHGQPAKRPPLGPVHAVNAILKVLDHGPW
jgi:hypothetical protein